MPTSAPAAAACACVSPSSRLSAPKLAIGAWRYTASFDNLARTAPDDVWTRVEAGAEIASEFAAVREERLCMKPDRGRPDQTNATGVQQRKI